MSARVKLRELGYSAVGAAGALAGSEQCMHMGRVRDSWDETACLDCDKRFDGIDALAADGGWNIFSRTWES